MSMNISIRMEVQILSVSVAVDTWKYHKSQRYSHNLARPFTKCYAGKGSWKGGVKKKLHTRNRWLENRL